MRARPLLLTVLAVLSASCSKSTKPTPADAELFVRELAFQSLNSGEPIDGHVTISPGKGFFVEVRIVPLEGLPERFADRDVNPLQEWRVLLNVHAPGASPDDRSAAKIAGHPLRPPGSKPMSYNHAGTEWQRSLFGFQHPPKFERPWDENVLRMWTFFAAPSVEPGDYVWELALDPTMIVHSAVRFQPGPPIVLKSGTLTVTAAEDGPKQ
ncbi:MAG: hypothetical protein KF774_08115 [Planctomyces sp.]|nr:hypothetical protein [Planctomyces sp.]